MKSRRRRGAKAEKKLERLRRRGKLAPDGTVPGKGKNRAKRHQRDREAPHREEDPSSDSLALRQP